MFSVHAFAMRHGSPIVAPSSLFNGRANPSMHWANRSEAEFTHSQRVLLLFGSLQAIAGTS
jgi:hypothetical protein